VRFFKGATAFTENAPYIFKLMPRTNRIITTAFLLGMVCLVAILPAFAQGKPSLKEDEGYPIQAVYQTKKSYVLRVRYTGPEDASPEEITMIDKPRDGSPVTTRGKMTGTNFPSGVLVEFPVSFEAGAHEVEFRVKTDSAGTATFSKSFKVKDLTTDWIIMGVGLLVGLLAIPFISYNIARTVNRAGDPPKAARVGFIVGILASVGLFLYLFAQTYGVLGIAIAAVAGLALIVGVFARR